MDLLHVAACVVIAASPYSDPPPPPPAFISSGPDLSANWQVRSVAAGDFNGDLLTDIAAFHTTPNCERSPVHIYLNQSSAPGTFGTPTSSPPQGAPATILEVGYNSRIGIAADLDGDADIDLVVCNRAHCPNGAPATYYGSISVLKNLGVNGGGQWQGFEVVPGEGLDYITKLVRGRTTADPPVNEEVKPHWVAVADVDNNGRLDILVANRGTSSDSGCISMFLADAVTPFLYGNEQVVAWNNAPMGRNSGNAPICIVLADLDNDVPLDLDLVVVNETSFATAGRFHTLYNNGNGTFSGSVRHLVSATHKLQAAVCADVYADGAIDIVAVDLGSNGTSQITVLRNAPEDPGAFTYDSGRATHIVSCAEHLVVGDYLQHPEGDPGLPDVIVASDETIDADPDVASYFYIFANETDIPPEDPMDPPGPAFELIPGCYELLRAKPALKFVVEGDFGLRGCPDVAFACFGQIPDTEDDDGCNNLAAATGFVSVRSLLKLDWNGVDGIDSQDFLDFLEDFFDGKQGADYNCSGGTESQDYLDFVDDFITGCNP